MCKKKGAIKAEVSRREESSGRPPRLRQATGDLPPSGERKVWARERSRGGGRPLPSSIQAGGGRGNLRRRCGTTTRYTTLPSDWVEQSDLVIVAAAAAVGDLRGVDGRRRPSPSFSCFRGAMGGKGRPALGSSPSPALTVISPIYCRRSKRGGLASLPLATLFFCPVRHHNASIFFFRLIKHFYTVPTSFTSITDV